MNSFRRMRRSKKVLKAATGAIFLVHAAVCLAVDGLAVSTRTVLTWPAYPGGDIVAYEIKNSDAISSTVLFDGKGGDDSKAASFARYPAINMEGTQVAFFRCTKDGKSYVSVVDVSGANLHDVAAIPAQTGYDVTGCLDWPRGRWVYYNMGDGNDGSKQIWRVNVDNPNNPERVVAFSYRIWQWQMSADAKRMHIRLSNNDGAGCDRIRYELPGNGTFSAANKCGYSIGCATILSPSGQWLGLMMGKHDMVYFQQWDSAQTNRTQRQISCIDFNTWAVNALTIATSCAMEDGSRMLVAVGCEMESNRWSCNSEKWVCLQTGLPQDWGNTGRFAFCGSNQTLLNWRDGIAVNVSKNRRSCSDPTWIPKCDSNWTGQFRRNDAGDFRVTAPLADVNADLAALAPEAPWRAAGSRMKLRAREAGLLIDAPLAERGIVRVFDARGRIVYRAQWGSGNSGLVLDTRIRPNSVYIVNLVSGNRTSTRNLCMMR